MAGYGWGWIEKFFIVERLTCDESVHDYGVVEHESHSEVVFVLQNTGNQPVEIQKVVSECGACVKVVDFSKGNILPRGTAHISLMLITDGFSGEFHKSIFVKYGRKYSGNMVLHLHGTIKDDFTTSQADI
jgi:Protein of unknown function (DUF1573).